MPLVYYCSSSSWLGILLIKTELSALFIEKEEVSFPCLLSKWEKVERKMHEHQEIRLKNKFIVNVAKVKMKYSWYHAEGSLCAYNIDDCWNDWLIDFNGMSTNLGLFYA